MKTLIATVVTLVSMNLYAGELTFKETTMCGAWVGCQVYNFTALDKKATDRCVKEGFRGAMRISEYDESRYPGITAEYECTDKNPAIQKAAFVSAPGYLSLTVNFEAYGWNALYASSRPEEFKARGTAELLEKAAIECAPLAAVQQGEIFFVARSMPVARYMDVTGGFFKCEEKK